MLEGIRNIVHLSELVSMLSSPAAFREITAKDYVTVYDMIDKYFKIWDVERGTRQQISQKQGYQNKLKIL